MSDNSNQYILIRTKTTLEDGKYRTYGTLDRITPSNFVQCSYTIEIEDNVESSCFKALRKLLTRSNSQYPLIPVPVRIFIETDVLFDEKIFREKFNKLKKIPIPNHTIKQHFDNRIFKKD